MSVQVLLGRANKDYPEVPRGTFLTQYPLPFYFLYPCVPSVYLLL